MPKLSHGGDWLPADYAEFLAQLKSRIVAARTRAVLAANSALIELYWEIGHEILQRSAREGWGSKVVDRLAADLRREFPDMTGLSRRNLLYMRALAEAWPGPDDGGGASCATARCTFAMGPQHRAADQARGS